MSEQNKGEFDALLSEIDTLAKALPGSGAALNDAERDELNRLRAASGNNGGGTTMAKAMKVTLPSGEEVEALDGGPILKSFETALGQTQGLLGKQGTLLKAMSASLDKANQTIATQADTIKAQGDKIASFDKIVAALGDPEKLAKALSDAAGAVQTVERIANQGAGRRSATVELVGTGADKDKPKGMPSGQFLAKAQGALKKGDLTGHEAVLVETAINNGRAVPPALVQKVIASQGEA